MICALRDVSASALDERSHSSFDDSTLQAVTLLHDPSALLLRI
jgi:hypothetical protein